MELYLYWTLLIVFLIIVEMFTMQLVSIWLAAGAVLGFVCCLFDLPFAVQLGVFAFSSLILLFATYPIMRRFAKKKKTGTNFELDIGEFAVVIEEINPKLRTGRVSLKGVDWSAVSAEGTVIPKDTVVVIKEVTGSRLVVDKQEVKV